MKRLLFAALALLAAGIAFAFPYYIVLASAGTVTGAQRWNGGIGEFTATSSSWSGATVTLEFLGPDGVTYVPAGSNTTCTANCAGVFYLPPGTIEVSVSGSPTALYAAAAQVTQP